MTVKNIWFKTLDMLTSPLVRSHRGFISRLIGLSAKSIYLKYENNNFDPYTNGEARVLKKLHNINRLKKNLFDVGANNGSWAEMARNICAHDTKIHCFEIIPETFLDLQKTVENLPNIVINNVGLSDKKETTTIYFDPKHSGTSTMYDPMFFDKSNNKKICNVIIGDEYVRDNKIDFIDYLKIDVEGMENLVLKGLQASLERKLINVIQFEYGMVNIQSRFLLKDFYELLGSYGYHIGKIYPEIVKFKKYEYYDENFIGPNYLAVNSECKDIFKQLAIEG